MRPGFFFFFFFFGATSVYELLYGWTDLWWFWTSKLLEISTPAVRESVTISGETTFVKPAASLSLGAGRTWQGNFDHNNGSLCLFLCLCLFVCLSVCLKCLSNFAMWAYFDSKTAVASVSVLTGSCRNIAEYA